jgi:hypothetical protein
MKKTYVDELTKEREGFVMRNPANGVEITCTKAFVEHWKKRGFEIVSEGSIRLMKDEASNREGECKE